jgi:flagellar hook-length control protein FliK
MADHINSVPFFPTAPPNRSSDPRKQTEEKKEESKDFTKTLSSAMNDNKPPAKTPHATKLDKPKLGNREPFFPATPKPYHPDPDQEVEVEGAMSTQPEGIDEKESVSEKFDDKAGIIGKSYDGIAVSYPVKRIASESLDDDAKEDLNNKGLWNVPTFMAALPTQKTMEMAKVVEKGKTETVSVPKPIAQFMASLESELGVSHDRLVRAFEELPKGSLTKSPNETMGEVVKNLNLEGEDEIKAVDLYSKMLSQMEHLNEKVPVAVVASSLPPEVSKPQAKLVASKYGAQAPNQSLSESAVKENTEGLRTDLVSEKIQAEPQQGAKSSLQTPASPVIATQVQSPLAQSVQNEAAQNQTVQTQVAQIQPAQQMAAFIGAVKKEVGDDSKAKPTSVESIKTSVKDLKPNPALSVQTQGAFTQENKNFVGMNGASVASLNGTEKLNSTGDSKHEAIQAIVNNARMLAQGGGGEMHMTLKPEHLGEIHLRVAMVGQKLDVQMTTERSDVKKLIEQSVHELKHGLAAHNLNMDKLDVSLNNKATQDFQQPSKDFAQAREFAQQFHQQNQARREMAEMGSFSNTANNSILSGRAESAQRMMASEALKNRVGGASKLHLVA